jgi:hypothetical protein
MQYVRVTIGEIARADGTVAYRLAVPHVSDSSRDITIIRPSGVAFPTPTNFTISFSSWAAMSAAFTGEWVYRSTSKTNPADIEEHRFTVAEPPHSALTDPFPTISPPNGSKVTSPFTVTGTPSKASWSYGSRDITGVKTTEVAPAEYFVTFGAVNSGSRIEFSAYTSNTTGLKSYVSAATTDTAAPKFQVVSDFFYTRSTEVEYVPVAVPEPTSLTLVVAAGLTAAIYRRRA